MEDKYTKIQQFITACDELIDDTFQNAEQKIAGILKAVSLSGELTELFTAAAEGFDFSAAKKAYFRYPAEKGATHGIAFLPSERKDILAFVFCILVELDAGAMKFSDFLLRYFYEDGSYTASFAVFANRMIRPFRDIVRSCFPEIGKKGQLELKGKQQDAVLGALSERVTLERTRVSALPLLEPERDAFETIFNELVAAVGRKDDLEIRAILAGYRYFLRYVNAENGAEQELFELANAL